MALLPPEERQVLLDVLTPPPGYVFEEALGTTFSLDLTALLTLPLCFSMFDIEAADEVGKTDPIALLEAVRRHAGRMTIFHQAGQIVVPRQARPLFAYLERSVVAVTPPDSTGVFHPKLWIGRYGGDDGKVLYRLICLTRNLTFDRSWDTILVLDGELTSRHYAFSANHPLGDFVEVLPRLALDPLDDAAHERVERMAYELRRTRFEPPEGFDDIAFWPLGIGERYKWPFGEKVDRLLVMAPFLSDGLVHRLGQLGEGNVLISRLDTLVNIPSRALEAFSRCFAFAGVQEGERDDGVEHDLSDLHAKLFVADAGWKAHVWTGSANATEAAFGKNVEFLVELQGKKSRCGIDAVLAEQPGVPSLRQLLIDYDPGREPVGTDPVEQELEAQLRAARRALIRAHVVGCLEPVGEGTFRLVLRADGEVDTETWQGTEVSCWPITLQDRNAAIVALGEGGNGVIATFDCLSFEAITPFIAFRLIACVGERTRGAELVLKVPLRNVPTDREQRLLQMLLNNEADVVRYLLFLLLEGDGEGTTLLDRFSRSMEQELTERPDGLAESVPLLEALLRALHREPQKLEQVRRLIDDLNQTPEGRAMLPAELDKVWGPIWRSYEELKGGAER